MNFTLPSKKGYTIYTKSECSFCSRVKDLLDAYELNYGTVDCDKYLLDSRDEFLEFIAGLAGKEYKTFPMVFYDGKFLGGYSDTKIFCDAKSD